MAVHPEEPRTVLIALDEAEHSLYALRWAVRHLAHHAEDRVIVLSVHPQQDGASSLILVGGDPGVGKSTLLLQVAALLAEGAGQAGPAPVLYVSGEESVEQVSSRAERMGVSAEQLFLLNVTDVEVLSKSGLFRTPIRQFSSASLTLDPATFHDDSLTDTPDTLTQILQAIQDMQPRAVVVDSIQTVYLAEATGSAGSVSQVRECATALLHIAKGTGTPIFLVGHVTKTGDIAGPRVLEHIVDVVLYMEGERMQSYRLLRSVKNRFGPADEVGVFRMEEEGLRAVANPSELFLSERAGANGSGPASAAIAVVMEGTRPLLIEIQALCSKCPQPPGRRTANGVDPQRLHLLLAVLGKQSGIQLYSHDVFLNVVGGLKLKEPAADLAVAVAVASSFLERPVPADMAVIGEVGLGGELRAVGQLERRMNEAAKLGFLRCIVPKSAASSKSAAGSLVTIPCATIRGAIEAALGPPPYQQ
eukprot:SM000089S23871  [mRNA]  locus=s89:483098:487966:- [translate_table: standard]